MNLKKHKDKIKILLLFFKRTLSKMLCFNVKVLKIEVMLNVTQDPNIREYRESQVKYREVNNY